MKQRIKIDGHLADAFQLPYGVPQGSVLGPSFFTLYTTSLSAVLSKCNVTHHLQADDTQIYMKLDSRNFDCSITELANCLEAIQVWMGNNKLKLNPNKMEIIVIGDDKIRSSMKSSSPVSFLGNIMGPAELVKTLVSSWMLTIQCKDTLLIYVAHVTTIPGNYVGSTSIQIMKQLLRWHMPWLAVPWITVIHCFITPKRMYCQTTKRFKMPYVVLCAK